MPIHSLKNHWVLETQNTAYVLGLTDHCEISHHYWGIKLPYLEDYPNPTTMPFWASFNGPKHLTPEEYPAYGGTSYVEPCLKATFANQIRDTHLIFDSAEVTQTPAPHLIITLKDSLCPLTVTLHYLVHETDDLIERWANLTNTGDSPINLERVWSAQWHLPPGSNYHWRYLNGRWLDEWHLKEEALQPGVKMLQSRRLTTSHHFNPWFAVHRGQATEDHGEVWVGLLVWSGNWQIAAEVTEFSGTRINIGLSDWDFTWRLMPGETFTTPAAIAGYSQHGFTGAGHLLHHHIRQQILPHPHYLRKVLYNSWEATTFYFDEALQMSLADQAAALGVELFVVDDGWFHGRNSDTCGLGDWWADEQKFPHGLNPLINHVNKLGMDFGLWLEPEMVNPDSELYRAHPDWVLHFPGRPRTESRNQLILNMARTDVQDYLINQLDTLLSNHNIAFIKWDMNRNVSEPGWPDAPGDPREVWVRYVQGVYRVWQTLKDRHPQIIWQTCSGGGGRADAGMLKLADQIWVSDNTDPVARIDQQKNFSLIFPPNTMESWVTKGEWLSSNIPLPLSFRFHVSMGGVLGIGANLNHLTTAEKEEAQKWIAVYKEIRPIIQHGNLYRLPTSQPQAFTGVQYVNQNQTEGVLFAFRTHLPEPAAPLSLRLRGLNPQTRYEVEGFGAKSGLAWMETDLPVALGNFSSILRRIKVK